MSNPNKDVSYPLCPSCLNDRSAKPGDTLFMNPRTSPIKKDKEGAKAMRYTYLCEDCLEDAFGDTAQKIPIPWPPSAYDLTSENHADVVKAAK